MRFTQSFMDEIRDRVPISDVVGTRVTWDKRKTNTTRGDYWARYPFLSLVNCHRNSAIKGPFTGEIYTASNSNAANQR